MPQVWIDVFVLRRYSNEDELSGLLRLKDNGQPQPEGYVHGILEAVRTARPLPPQALQPPPPQHEPPPQQQRQRLQPHVQQQQQRQHVQQQQQQQLRLPLLHTIALNATGQPYPIWHYDNRKAIELWPREFFTPEGVYTTARVAREAGGKGGKGTLSAPMTGQSASLSGVAFAR
eukprot:365635-Chlamydomonas_euryale.AAC.1